MGFSRQEYWSVLPSSSSLGDLPNLGIKSVSPVPPALEADSLSAEPSGPHTWLNVINILFFKAGIERQGYEKDDR